MAYIFTFYLSLYKLAVQGNFTGVKVLGNLVRAAECPVILAHKIIIVNELEVL